jgi:hypothetical protein
MDVYSLYIQSKHSTKSRPSSLTTTIPLNNIKNTAHDIKAQSTYEGLMKEIDNNDVKLKTLKEQLEVNDMDKSQNENIKAEIEADDDGLELNRRSSSLTAMSRRLMRRFSSRVVLRDKIEDAANKEKSTLERVALTLLIVKVIQHIIHVYTTTVC